MKLDNLPTMKPWVWVVKETCNGFEVKNPSLGVGWTATFGGLLLRNPLPTHACNPHVFDSMDEAKTACMLYAEDTLKEWLA